MLERSQLEYLHNYELVLTQRLLEVAVHLKFSNGQLYSSDDLNRAWAVIAPDYMVDAVPNVAKYPMASIAWSGYIGLALAYMWDKDWNNVDISTLYSKLVSPRGFDELDEYITEEILNHKLGSDNAMRIENLMRSLSESALNIIRHEQVEPQSEMAFHVYARTIRAVFHVGVSCELYILGYKWSSVDC